MIKNYDLKKQYSSKTKKNNLMNIKKIIKYI